MRQTKTKKRTSASSGGTRRGDPRRLGGRVKPGHGGLGAVDFEVLFESAPGLYLVLSPELTIVAVNAAYAKATMTVKEDIVGRALFEVFPENVETRNADGESNARDSFERVLRFKRPDVMAVQKYDIRKPAAEGGAFEERWWSALNVPVLDEKGRVRWILHHPEDVTELMRLKAHGEARDRLAREQQRAIAELRAANDALARAVEENARLEAARRSASETLKNTVESMADPMLVADESGAIVLANQAALKLFGALGGVQDLHKNRQLFRPDGVTPLPAEQAPLTRAVKGEGIDNLEFIRRGAGAKDLHFIASSRPIRDSKGALKGAVAVYHDITQMRATEIQLRQAQKMEAVGQLTGGLAHDFNNVLTVIIGMIAVLADELADKPELARMAGMIDEAAERGAQMIKNLLAFARKQPLQPRATDINALVRESGTLLKPALGEQIEIKVFADDAGSEALVDPSQLSSAILNLAINARDAMKDGGKLTIETKNVVLDETYAAAHAEVKAGAYVLLAISDTGTGMPPAIMERIFEPFFTTKGLNSGTGLGLSMVYGFVKQTGGHIKVYSEEGHGTTFKLYLPRAGASGDESAGAAAAASLSRGHETILVVEDDPLVRGSVIAQLKSLGYAIHSVVNAAEALAFVDGGGRFDLLFTDVILPGGLNGRQLADEVEKRRPGTKVLFTSGYTENAMLRDGRIDSGVMLLAKPYRKSELARSIRAALGDPETPARLSA